VPLPGGNSYNPHTFIFRILFKPESGKLWGFNEFFCDPTLYHELDIASVIKNQTKVDYKQGFANMSRESLEEEIQQTEGN